MIFHPTRLAGAYVIEPQRIEDSRGFFARSWCKDEFELHGLDARLVQCNISFNHRAGTLRGMHYQAAPHAEAKLVRCTMGALYDVIVDLRKDSPTYLRHIGVELTAANRHMLYVPEGCAHGFITLADATEVFYQMNRTHHPDAARGIRYNDPALGIAWPREISVIHERDAAYPDFVE